MFSFIMLSSCFIICGSVAELDAHLKLPSTRARLCEWEKEDCPVFSNDYAVMKERCAAYSEKRIKREINQWDAKTNIISGEYEKLLSACKSNFLSIDKQVQSIEADIAGRKIEKVAMTREDDTKKSSEVSTGKKIAFGVTAPVWVPIGVALGVVLLPVLGAAYIKDKVHRRKTLEKFQADPEEYMSELMKETITNMTKCVNGDLTYTYKLIEERFSELNTVFDALFEQVPRIVAADEELVKRLKQKAELHSAIRKVYREKCNDGVKLCESIMQIENL